ncbi:MAG: DUF1761 domain-containing protein [Planctomycetes bacterium]|nr:DUF1761 domain-containing protein [Planctomycetota bacterium]
MPNICDCVNGWSVLVSTLVAFVIGGLWYSPVLFSNAWVKAHGFTEAHLEETKKRGCAGPFATALITYFIMGWVMAVFAGAMKMPSDWMCALGFGFLCWLGFSMPITLTHAKFVNAPICAWMVDAGHSLVTLIAMAEVIMLWPK